MPKIHENNKDLLLDIQKINWGQKIVFCRLPLFNKLIHVSSTLPKRSEITEDL